MSFSIHLANITTLAQYASLDQARQELLVVPGIEYLVARTSWIGRIVQYSNQAVYCLFGTTHDDARFQSTVNTIRQICDEVIAWNRDALASCGKQAEVVQNMNQLIPSPLRKLSWQAQMLCGACFDHKYRAQAAYVYSCIVRQQHSDTLNYMQDPPKPNPEIEQTISDASITAEKFLYTPLVASVLIEELAGRSLDETTHMIQTVRHRMIHEEMKNAHSVHSWISAVNSSCAAILPPHFFSEIIYSSLQREEIGSTTHIKPIKQEWSIAWNLYHMGLAIGPTRALPNSPFISLASSIFLSPSPQLPNGCECVYNDALSTQTSPLHLIWYTPSSPSESPCALVESHLPLLLGLYTIQQEDRERFLFPPLSCYPYSDGQSAFIPDRPLCMLDSESLWSQDPLLSGVNPVAVYAAVVQKMISLSFTPRIESYQYGVTYTHRLFALCPVQAILPEFSWVELDKQMEKLLDGHIEKKAEIYCDASIWKHPDLVWMEKNILKYGLSIPESELIRTCRIELVQGAVSSHATDVLLREVGETLEIFRAAYKKVLQCDPHCTESQFLQLAFQVCKKSGWIMPRQYKVLAQAIIDALVTRAQKG